MDITSLNSARDQIESRTDQVLTTTAVEAVDNTLPQRERHGLHGAGADISSSVVLHLQRRPLDLTRKILVDKINEVFEVHDPAATLSAPGDEPSTDQAAAEIVRCLALAYRTFKTRFGDVDDSEILHRFQALASQAITEGLLEARTYMARLDIYEARTADQLNLIDDQVNMGLASLASGA